jgi:hypothetical protein
MKERLNNSAYEEIRNARIKSIMESKPYNERRTMTSSALGHMLGLDPDEARAVINRMVLDGQLIKTIRANKAYFTPPPPNILSRDWRVDHSVHDMVDQLMRDR